DKTLGVLEQIHKELPGLTHYAVLAASFSVAELRKRRRDLDNVGISPLWYLPGDFGSIERILADLIQEASTRLIWKPKRETQNRPPSGTGGGRPGPGPVSPVPLVPSFASIEQQHRRVARRLARRIVNGRLAFFLGAGAHMRGELSARAFYRSI